MDPENSGRAGLALPSPQRPPSGPEIELSEAPLHDPPLPEKVAPSPPHRTWQTLLKRELEFLGVTQILVALLCLCFGTVVSSMLHISEFKEDYFSSFKAGYPFWGAVFEIVAMILFLTILGFCSAISLTIYGLGEVFKRTKRSEDRLYEELSVYSPIYSELEERAEASSPTD